MDLISRYHQVWIKDEDMFQTPFRTRYDYFKFVVMSFGLKKYLQYFMCLMNSILSKYLDKFIVVFIDKILVYSKNKQEHGENLKIILQVLRKHLLFSKFSKCDFFKGIIQYLGQVVPKYGILVDLDKIKAITQWFVQKNLTHIRSFMGIMSYYRKFIKVFSKISYPITSLQKKVKKFHWNKKCMENFNN